MARNGGPPPASCCPLRCSKATIRCLAHDATVQLLRHVLLRLPSLTALARAAFTCRWMRRLVASDPEFRRLFRATHPPPLLGLFFDSPSPTIVPAIPSFVPARRNDPDIAGAILAGDFFLTALQVEPRVPPRWCAIDSRDGHLLLMNWANRMLAVLNPLAWQIEGYFDLNALNFLDGADFVVTEGRLLCTDEHPSRFRIFCLVHDASRVQVVVFAHDDRDGVLLPSIAAPDRPDPEDDRLDWVENGTQAGEFIYWFYSNHEFVIILDTNTKNPRCYVQGVHPSLTLDEFESYVLGEDQRYTVDQVTGITRQLPLVPYIVYANGITISTLYGGMDGDLNGRWTATELIDLNSPGFPEIHHHHRELVALRDGILYFATLRIRQHHGNPSLFASLDMERKKSRVLFLRTYDAGFQPYHMPWPRFLLGDYGVFAG
ncbi:hypothetical protein ACP70R_037803 [Stipagrostis hirtigluma subsp. patula]